MVLSLTDILTAQAADRPYKAADSYKNASADSVSFKDVLNKPDADEPVRNVKKAGDAVKNNVEEDSASITNGKLVAESANNVIAPDSGANGLSVNNIDTSISKVADTITTEVQNNISTATTSEQPQVTLNDLTSALQTKQDSGAALTSDQQNAANAMFAKLADNGIPQGVSADQVVDQILAQINSTGLDANSSVDDILQKMNFANTDKKQGLTAEQLAAQALSAAQVAGADISKSASKVIEAAKEVASKPEISASNLRSLQVASLSNIGKKKDKTGDGASSSTLDINNDFIIAATDVNAGNIKDIRQNSTEQLQSSLAQNNNLIDQNKIDDNLALDSKAQNFAANPPAINPANVQQNNAPIVNTAAAISQVVGQAELEKDDLVSSAPKNAINLGGMSTENFIKFQTMLDDAQAAAKSTTNTMAGSPKEVMAQIKFGLAGAGKNESNISIQLHPKDLGKVDITMQMNADGKTHITVIAEKTETLNLLQKESDSLKGMLMDALKTDSSNLNFSFQERGADDWRQQFSNNRYAPNRIDSSDSVSGNYLASQSYRYNMIATDGLDIRV